MTTLIIGLIIFMAVHSVRIYGEGFRTQLIARLGSLGWKGVYSVASVLGLVLIASGYGELRQTPVVLWESPAWISHPVSLLMLLASIFLVAAYVPRNGIRAKVRHPMVIGVKIWAFSHLLANGTLADVLVFGSFLIWAVLSFRAARRRDHGHGDIFAKSLLLGTLATVGIGVGLWAWFVFHGHAWLIGVQPIILK
jgi:uncharacterized membrane protein